MKRRRFIKLAAGTISCGLYTNSCPAVIQNTSSRPLVMGIFPRRNPQQSFKLFKPLANHLGKAISREVVFETTRNFSEFWNNIKSGRYDIVHYNQYHYIVSNILFGHQVILMNHEFGNASIASAISVRKDSGIQQVSDLKNRSILFAGDKMAMQSYIGAKWLLKKHGLNDGDYIEKFAINPPNALMSTYQKQADAAATGDSVIRLDVVKNTIDIAQMKYLLRGKPLAHLPWAVTPEVPVELKRQIQTALTGLRSEPEGHQLLDNAKLTALIPAVDSDFNEHRRIVRDVYGRKYGIENFK